MYSAITTTLHQYLRDTIDTSLIATEDISLFVPSETDNQPKMVLNLSSGSQRAERDSFSREDRSYTYTVFMWYQFSNTDGEAKVKQHILSLIDTTLSALASNNCTDTIQKATGTPIIVEIPSVESSSESDDRSANGATSRVHIVYCAVEVVVRSHNQV